MIRLIVNADDLGLHPAIDEGIFRAHGEGIVTSATVLVTGPSAKEAVRRANEQGLPLGVHLCLCTHLSPAAPPDQVRHLAPQGRFRRDWLQFSRAFALRSIPKEEIDLELRAQLARMRELGGKPDHLDAHQHLHLLPGVRPLVERIAAEEGLPLRWPLERPRARWLFSPKAAARSAVLSALAYPWRDGVARKVRSVGVFEAGRLDEAALLEVIRTLGDGDWELGCHPGYQAEVPEQPGWKYGWEAELAALTSPRVKAEIAARGVELTTYSALTARRR